VAIVRNQIVVSTVVASMLAGVAVVHAEVDGVRTADTLGVAGHIRTIATRYNISPRLVEAIIRVESDFNPRARSPLGARGLMQIMPGTAMLFGARDAYDPRQNITAGVRYLRTLHDRFGNDLPLVLAAYNAGEQAVLRYGGVPPFPATRAFVARVLGLIGRGWLPPADALARRDETATEAEVTYHPRATLDALGAGVPKERVFDALATEWTQDGDRLVKLDGLRIRISRRSVQRTLLEAGDVVLRETGGVAALYWLLFEDHRLVAAGRADDWPKAVPRDALALDYTPGGPLLP
jgi:transglycosylase-like protein with SLT domain